MPPQPVSLVRPSVAKNVPAASSITTHDGSPSAGERPHRHQDATTVTASAAACAAGPMRNRASDARANNDPTVPERHRSPQTAEYQAGAEEGGDHPCHGEERGSVAPARRNECLICPAGIGPSDPVVS